MNDLYYEEFVPTGIDEEQYDTVRKYYDVFLSDLNGQDIRNIAIISNRICEQKGRKYLKIVGLDVFTGKVVSLIDNHGKNYGLCSYSEDCAKLKSKMVIKVPVELCENVFVQAGKKSIKLFNVLRIKGKHEVLGTTNWFKLKEKYEKLHYTSKSDLFNLFIQPISAFKVFELFKNSENLSFYIPVRFPGTHYIKTEGAKATLYNPETRKSFNFISTTKKLLYNTGKYMDGIVIAKITIEDNKTTVLIDKAIICKYFRYSKSERNNDFFRKIEQYYADLEAEDMASYPEYIYDSSGYDDDEADYSDKYRLYDSMEEYCDEYEKFRELETSDEKYFWY